MPLITKLFPKLERAQQSDDGAASLKQMRKGEEHYNIVDEYEYSDFEEGEEDDVDMDGNSVLHRPRPRKLVPDLPARSQLRASRVLENLTIQLNDLEQAALDDAKRQNVEDPHEHYLSSEEEASESADEYDESIIELDSDRPPSSRASSRQSYEETAHVVSFMFVGRPTLVEITLEKPSSTIHLQRLSSRRPSPLRLTPSTSMTSLRAHRPTTSRTSSLGAPTNTLSGRASKSSLSKLASKANFLSHDPYPASEAQDISVYSTADQNRNSKSNSNSNSDDKEIKSSLKDSWKLNRHFSLSKHRKASISNLARLSTMSSTMSAFTLPIQSNVTASPTTISPQDKRKSADSGIVRYEDILRSAIRAPPVPSPVSTNSPLMGRFTRTKSLKA